MSRSFVLALVLLAAALGHADAASFDCAKAGTADERTVCANPRLSELDEANAAAFNEAVRAIGRADILPTARDFQADRRACAANVACLMASYIGSITIFQGYGGVGRLPPWADATAIAAGNAPLTRGLPTRIGQCVATQVARITPRLDFGRSPAPEDYDSGTAVEFANGGYQVSYSREDAILASRPGQGSVMCLTSIPRRCPPGDVRGRVYTTTNVATRATWTLPDSQHSCGGA